MIQDLMQYDTIKLDALLVKKMILHTFFYHNYVKIKVDSYGSLPLEKTSAFYFITLINSLN